MNELTILVSEVRRNSLIRVDTNGILEDTQRNPISPYNPRGQDRGATNNTVRSGARSGVVTTLFRG